MHQRRSIFQCGREITSEEIDEIQETVRLFQALSRTELAATICEHLGWFTASGGYKTDDCLKLLEKLEAKGYFELPGRREGSRGKPIPTRSSGMPNVSRGIACLEPLIQLHYTLCRRIRILQMFGDLLHRSEVNNLLISLVLLGSQMGGKRLHIATMFVCNTIFDFPEFLDFISHFHILP